MLVENMQSQSGFFCPVNFHGCMEIAFLLAICMRKQTIEIVHWAVSTYNVYKNGLVSHVCQVIVDNELYKPKQLLVCLHTQIPKYGACMVTVFVPTNTIMGQREMPTKLFFSIPRIVFCMVRVALSRNVSFFPFFST